MARGRSQCLSTKFVLRFMRGKWNSYCNLTWQSCIQAIPEVYQTNVYDSNKE